MVCSRSVFCAELGDAIASLHPDAAPEFTRGNAKLLSALIERQKFGGDLFSSLVDRL